MATDFDNLDPLMAAANPAVLSDLLIEKGFRSKEIFSGTGLEETFLNSPYNPISYNGFQSLIERALELTENPRLGLEFGRRVGVTGQGRIGLARISNSSLRGFLDFATRAVRVTFPSVGLDTIENLETGSLRISISELLSWGNNRQFYIDYLFAGFAQNIKVFAPEHAANVVFNSTEERDTDLELFKEFLHSQNINFRQGSLSLDFPASMVNATVYLDNPLTVRQGEELLQGMIEEFESDYDPILLQLRRILLTNHAQTPNAARVAHKLGISVRTLHRHLARHGTSFRELTIDCQLSIATELLALEHYPIARIAERLGYSQASNFGVAFKHWTGMTPVAYRKKLLTGHK